MKKIKLVAPLLCGGVLLSSCSPELLNNLLKPSPEKISPSVEPESFLKPTAPPSLAESSKPVIRASGPLSLPTATPTPIPTPTPLVAVSGILVAPPANFILDPSYKAIIPMDYGAKGARLKNRRQVIYAGGPTESFFLHFKQSRLLPEGQGVKVMSGDGTEVARVTQLTQRVQIPGNTAILEASWDGQGDLPETFVALFSIHTGKAPSVPVEESGLKNKLSSFPLPLNTPVTLIDGRDRDINQPNKETTYFVSVPNVRGKAIDITIDGRAKILVSEESNQFLLSNSDLAFREIDSRAFVGSTHTISLRPANVNTLFLTVTLDGDFRDGYGILSVNEIKEEPRFQVYYEGSATEHGFADEPTMRTQVSQIMQQASRLLYQATEGRIRVKNYGLNIKKGCPPLNVLPVDPHVCITTQDILGDFWRSHALPGNQISLEKQEGAPSDTRSAETLGNIWAHEFMHWRFAVLDEYGETFGIGPSVSLCPISMMDNHRATELCWSDNHNPTGNAVLAIKTGGQSMWAALGQRLNFTPPSNSPVRVLRPNSGVNFPM